MLIRGAATLSNGLGTADGPIVTLQGSSPGSGAVAGAKIENAGTLTINGAGTLIRQANTTGVSFLNTGTLIKEGNNTFTIDSSVAFTNSGSIFVRSGALKSPGGITNTGLLGGAGVLNLSGGTLLNRGTLSPGNSPGKLSIDGKLVQDALGVLEIELASPTDFDSIDVTGAMVLNGSLRLVCYLNCALSVGTRFIIAQSAASLSGTFAELSLQGFGTGAFSVSYDNALRQVSLVVTEATSPVPDVPSSVLLALGISSLGLLKRRRQTLARRRQEFCNSRN